MTEKRKYRKPVAWLGGRDLLANLKYFLLFAAYKGKLDPRDWMRAEAFPPPPETELDRQYIKDFRNSFAGLYDKGEFWFDYFADAGDGMTAGYALGYLCMSDLAARLPANWDAMPAGDKRQALKEGKLLSEIRSHLAAGHSESEIALDCEEKMPDWIRESLKDPNARESVIAKIEAQACGVVVPDLSNVQTSDGWLALPRGAFLFVGGDTAYHVADFGGLALRFQQVFDWAFKDLKRRQGLSDEDAERRYWQEPKRRPLFGVPGNHDYYDMIDGFNRQFARPITRENRFINLARRNFPPQLRLRLFKRFQTASYVAVKLPFNWWFWGIDSELDNLDLRQQEFFKRSYALSLEGQEKKTLEDDVRKNLRAEYNREPTEEEFARRFPRLFQTGIGNIWKFPPKLIVASSEPSTVEGKRAREDDKTSRAFKFLDLTRPFLYLSGGVGVDKETERFQRKLRHDEQERHLPNFECRLDISGDVHHYARYWGEDTGDPKAPAQPSYASIVSGGGGASMSPTQTDYNEIEEQVLYPSKRVSKRAINRRLFNPWVVMTGGNVWVAGAVIAIVVYFAAGIPAAHHDFTNSAMDVLLRVRPLLGLAPARLPHVTFLRNSWSVVTELVRPFLLILSSILAVGAAGLYSKWLFQRLTKTYDWVRDRLLNLQLERNMETDRKIEAEKEAIYRAFQSEIEGQTNRVPFKRLIIFWVTAIVMAALTVTLWRLENSQAGFWILLTLQFLMMFGICFLSYHRVQQFDSRAAILDAELDHWPKRQLVPVDKIREQVNIMNGWTVTSTHDYLPFWGLVVFPGAYSLFRTFEQYSGWSGQYFPPFSASVLILLCVAGAVGVGLVSTYYSKWLFEQSYRVKVTSWSYAPVIFLSTGAIFFLGLAVWLYGLAPVRLITENIALILAVVLIIGGCLFLAMKVGNHVYSLPRHIIFALLGLWHGLLQLTTPFLLVWLGGPAAFVTAFAVTAFFSIVPILLIKGLSLRNLDYLIHRFVLPFAWLIFGLLMIAIPIMLPRENPGILIIGEWAKLSLLGNLLAAGCVGAVLSCVWLGWYFAVALVYDGHANEAGSTARTEDYKQFIRFRVRESDLTGFVIGIDFPHAPVDDNDARDGSTLKPRLIDVFTLKCGTTPEPS